MDIGQKVQLVAEGAGIGILGYIVGYWRARTLADRFLRVAYGLGWQRMKEIKP